MAHPAYSRRVPDSCDIAVVGAGAAGLMAAIAAGRVAERIGRTLRIVALDGAAKLGAKILVAGGGRCNVTHHAVDESAYAGSSRHAIRKVLGRFGVPETVAFFSDLGVELKREETGKLFPVTDDAHTVLDALLAEAKRLGVELRHPWRVIAVERASSEDGGFIVRGGDARTAAPGEIHARRVILATGGMALPRSGSDGAGYALARSLGHTITDRVFPALVPLLLADGHFVRSLSGVAVPATLEVRTAAGKRLAAFTNSTLCTHFGLSGPGPMDISRYWSDARASDPAAVLVVNWLPALTPDALDALLLARPSRPPMSVLTRPPCALPERLARALCDHAGLGTAADGPAGSIARDARRALVTAATSHPLPVVGDRGFTHAEVTAGGVPLAEVRLDTMESRVCQGLHLCGEILDVDGRIGGFNFQWAWASGFVAGSAAAAV